MKILITNDDAVYSGFVSVTPMKLDRTNLNVFDELKALNDAAKGITEADNH